MDRLNFQVEHRSGIYNLEIPEGVSLIDCFEAIGFLQKLMLLQGEKLCPQDIDGQLGN